jgi:hypothetical protein
MKRIDHLQDHLTNDPEIKVQAAEQFRSLIKSIEVHPLPEKGRVNLKITGDLSALALLDKPGQKTDVSVVAEEGLEPPTQGL